MSDVLIRVWREGWGQWWAEFFVPRQPRDQPAPEYGLSDWNFPPWPDGMTRKGLKLRSSRRSAVRAARRMRAHHMNDHDPERGPRTPPVVEVVQ